MKSAHAELTKLPIVGKLQVIGSGDMLDWSQCSAVQRSPDRVSGQWVFRGTRVPVSALFENLESGARVDEFLQWFPGVTKDQVLEHAANSLAVA